MAFVAAVTGGAPAGADHCDTAALSRLLVGDDDVPVGFAILPDASGELDARLLRQFAPGQDVSAFEQICGYARVWANSDGDGIQATVWDLRSEEAATAMLMGMAKARASVLARFDVPEVTGEVAMVLEGRAPSPETGRTVLTVFRSGRHVFAVAVGAAEANLVAVSRLTAAQLARSPSGSDGGGEPVSWATITGQMARQLPRVLGPLPRRRCCAGQVAGSAPPPPPPAGDADGAIGGTAGAAADVSVPTRRRCGAAGIGFVSQVFGASLLLPGLIPAFWPDSLPSRLRRRSDGGRHRVGPLFTGKRAVRVSVLYTVALVLFAAAAALALTSMLQAPRNGPLVVSQPSGEHFVVDEGTLAFLPYAIAIAAVAVAVWTSRRARRLAALDAQVLMERDGRPIVLYLRSFTDDDIRIRAGVTGRRSLVEQLSPRRFDRFARGARFGG